MIEIRLIFIKFRRSSCAKTKQLIICIMNVLVINCGSSSIKFQLYQMSGEVLLVTGKVEQRAEGNFDFLFNFQKKTIRKTKTDYSYFKVLNEIIKELINLENECIHSISE